MKCNHCGSEWTTAVENQKNTCPFCGKQLENTNNSQPAARGRFQLSYDKTTLVQFLGDEKNVVIPAGITRIGAGAFHGYGVETVYIPDGVTEIGDNCFNGCKQLREVRIPSSVTYISDSAFKDTGKKRIIAEKGSYAWNKYAKPVTDDKPVTSNTPAEATPIKESSPVSLSKPAEEPKRTVTPTEDTDTKEPLNAQPAGNQPSVDEFIDKQISKIQTQQTKEIQRANLLGCKPGKTPWTMSISWFGSAGRLINRIKCLSDQELLARIAREARRIDVKSTAIMKITDQELLRKYACSKYWQIREAATKHLEDQKVLEQLALNDYISDVQEAAVMRLENPAVLRKVAKSDASKQARKTALLRLGDTSEMKVFLMSDGWGDTKMLDRITVEDDLVDLAMQAKSRLVRSEATDRLPAEKTETKLLKAAAELSYNSNEDNTRCFRQLCNIMVNEDPSFLKKLANYPDPNVLTLIEQYKPSTTNLVESMINTGDNKAYFDDGVVYAITRHGEIKIGYYDDTHAYDENEKEIASFTHNDDGVFIQFNHLGQITYLKEMYARLAEKEPYLKETYEETSKKECAMLLTFEYANAASAGYIEETNGEYRNVAYLRHRSSNTPRERILGMAAAFVCLQKFVWTDENRYSRFYKR